MDITLHDSEIRSISGHPSDENDIAAGLTMERIKFTGESSEITIWLSQEQTDQLRAALDKIYPVNYDDLKTFEQWVDEHAEEVPV